MYFWGAVSNTDVFETTLKLYIFDKFLLKKLPTINNPLPFNVLQDVDMDSYKIIKKEERQINLSPEGELKPISDTVGKFRPETYEKLSKIVRELNDAFGTKIINDFDKVELDTSLIKYSREQGTGSAYVALNKTGDRRIYAHSGAANILNKEDIRGEEIIKSKIIFLSSFFFLIFFVVGSFG